MKKTKYFLDTEFIEDGKTIDLISLGLVCEDGRKLYIQNSECDFRKASDWVFRNVFPHLDHFEMHGSRPRCTPTGCAVPEDSWSKGCPWRKRGQIRDIVLNFCDVEKYGKPEFWGYFADYDWVVFCQLFGTMMDLPKGFPMYCRDLKQWADELGDVRLPKPKVEIHNALVDAEWVKSSYELLSCKPGDEK